MIHLRFHIIPHHWLNERRTNNNVISSNLKTIWLILTLDILISSYITFPFPTVRLIMSHFIQHQTMTSYLNLISFTFKSLAKIDVDSPSHLAILQKIRPSPNSENSLLWKPWQTVSSIVCEA